MKFLSAPALLFSLTIISLTGLVSCGQNIPRDMRAQKDELTYESQSPLENIDYIGRSNQNNRGNSSSTNGDPCTNEEVTDDNLFNTTLKLCRPDDTQETYFAAKYTKAPTSKVCFFPVYEEPRNTNTYYPQAVGQAQCISFKDNTYQYFHLHRDRQSNGNYNYQGSNYRITGVIVMADTSGPHLFPCNNPTNYTSLCVGRIQQYSLPNVPHRIAYQAAQDYWEFQEYNINAVAYLFLQDFYSKTKYTYYILP